eukprot:TRINITY_DN5060_c0_g1_i1.p1 TRINITY_DN5060_c0_g1~~TRINITY_DN5060_c0_g1_i1.p1  ORF type:complete len:951 (+),score=122.76 TRINITY_DN5060_c0_g1_i1:20-2872(+)
MEAIPHLKQAIHTLYHSNSEADRKSADQWLVDFSETTSAWQASISLIKDNEMEIKFFGASLLARKVKEGWLQLDESAQGQLYGEILSLAISSCALPLTVQEQLITAVASTVIHLLKTRPTVLDDIFGLLASPPEGFDPRLVRILAMNILARIPEEFDNVKLSFTQSSQVKRSLTTQLANILAFTGQILNQPDDEFSIKFKNSALRCCNHWSTFGMNLGSIIQASILDQIFENLTKLPLFEETSELLQRILTQGTSNAPQTGFKSARETNESSLTFLHGQNPVIVQNILRRLLWTKSIFESPNIQVTPQHTQIATLITGVGEANIPFFSKPLDEDSTILQMEFMKYLVLLVSSPSLQISEITFPFWTVLEKEERQQSTDNMKTVFFTVLNSVLNNITSDSEGLSNYKKHSTRVLKSCLRVLTPDNFLRILAEKFQTGNGSMKSVVLYALSAVPDFIPIGHPDIAGFLSKIHQVGIQESQNKQLIIESCSFLGKYSHHIQETQIASDLLYFLLRILSDLNANWDVLEAASDALKFFCINCQGHVGPHLEEISRALIPFLGRNSGNQDTGESLRQSVLEGIFSTLYGMDMTNFSVAKDIIGMIVTPICNNIIEFQNTSKVLKIREEILCLSSIFNPSPSLPPSEIQTQLLITISSPIFTLISDLHANLKTSQNSTYMEDLNESVCTVVSRFVLGVRASMPLPVLNYLICLLSRTVDVICVQAYTALQHIIQYNVADPTKKEVVLQAMVNIVTISFNLLRNDNSSPLMIEGFFELLSVSLSVAPEVFLTADGNLVLSLVSAAVHGMNTTSISVSKSILSFIDLLFFGPHTRDPSWQTLLSNSLQHQNTGASLLNSLLRSLVTRSHFKLIQLQSSILHQFIFSPLRELSLKFIYESVASPSASPLPGHIFQDQDKETVLKVLAKTENPRLFKMLIKDLADVANGKQTIDALGNYF